MRFAMMLRAVAAAATLTLAAAVLPAGGAYAINGGNGAAQGEFPFMVRLLPVGCAGTLISPQIVLTAGHCIDPENDGLTAIIGTVDQADPDATTRIPVVATHSGVIDGIWWESDWGLAKLAEPVDLPTVTLAGEASQDYQTLTTLGWGRSKQDQEQQRFLQRVEVPFMDDAACTDLEGTDGQYHPDRNVCTVADDSTGFCSGDSGGPALNQLTDSGWEQVGIVSFGGDCDPGYADRNNIFTEVAAFAGAIRAAEAALMAQP